MHTNHVENVNKQSNIAPKKHKPTPNQKRVCDIIHAEGQSKAGRVCDLHTGSFGAYGQLATDKNIVVRCLCFAIISVT